MEYTLVRHRDSSDAGRSECFFADQNDDLEPHTLDECATHEEFMAMCHAPPTRPCKYDGEPITYDPSENVWTRRGLHEYGRHDGPCGRKLVLLRLTPGTPPWRALVPPPGGQRE